jgi:hypothetical protein
MEKRGRVAKLSKTRIKVAQKIEEVFDEFYQDKSAYSKGQFYKNEFFLRTDHALVVLNKNNDILVSFADHTRPSYAALFTMLLDEIEDANLFICEDYRTDRHGSMIINEADGKSTAAIIWDEKEMYYKMLKKKVTKIVIRKTKKKSQKQNEDQNR